MRRLPLNLWWRDLLLVGVGTVDRLRWLLGVYGSLQLFFFLLDEGALISPMTFVSAMNAAVGYFLFSVEFSLRPRLELFQSLLPPLLF